MITAADVRDFPTQPVVESNSLSNFLGKKNERTIPISNAITGSPMKSNTSAVTPSPNGAPGKSDIDLSTINTNGITTGMKERIADGASLELSSSTVISPFGSGSMYVLAAYFVTKKYDSAATNTLIMRPISITSPKSAPRMAAAATGPGVGGTKQ